MILNFILFRLEIYGLSSQQDSLKAEVIRRTHLNHWVRVGISIVSSWEEMESTLAQHDKAIVIQNYVERPLIIFRRKFDIRQWVLVTTLSPLTVYWHDQCYLRFSSKEYDINDENAIHDK